MYIKAVTWRNRDDFHFTCACQHCGHEFHRGDGYANEHFQNLVLPNQHCPKCDANHWGEKPASQPTQQPEE